MSRKYLLSLLLFSLSAFDYQLVDILPSLTRGPMIL